MFNFLRLFTFKEAVRQPIIEYKLIPTSVSDTLS